MRESELLISVGGLPPLSARGCNQELMPIIKGEFRRTISGELLYLGLPTDQRYRSVVTCEDGAAFAAEGIWPGQKLKLGCIQRLWHKVNGREVQLAREPVAGSVVALTNKRQLVRIESIKDSQITLEALGEEVFVSYRPWLAVQVIHFQLFTKEWQLKAGWRLEVEEG